MGNTPFKMKGSPMKRNFGIGSPVKDTPHTTTTSHAKHKHPYINEAGIVDQKKKAAYLLEKKKENVEIEGGGSSVGGE
mgnify:CR=1 FL=1